jgi:hypothetical protein
MPDGLTRSFLGAGLALALSACSGGLIGGSPGPSASPSPTASPTPYVASTSSLRRLSRAELDATIRDVFGDDSAPSARFLGEDEITPFDNDATAKEPSRALIDGLDALGAAVAERVLADPQARTRLLPCTPASPGDATCFRELTGQLARRALRRPLAADEVDRYAPLLAFATEASPHWTPSFDIAVALLIRSLVLDPEFVHRVERRTPTTTAGVGALDGPSVASRLSYLLWGTAPDDALLDAAEQGTLATPAGRKAAAERLLRDPRARTQLRRFHAMWLGYRTLPHPATLTRAFQTETSALVDRVVFEDARDYLDLFRLDETWLDATLATHYGLPAPATASGAWVHYPADSQRAGILGHGSVLAAFSKFTDTSPTQRGILVRSRLLCQPITPPPPTVMADAPPGDGTAACKKDRYLAHVGSGSCAGCHSQMDPIGFGLEGFDIAGRARAHDDGKPQCLIDGTGALPGAGAFRGPRELSERLIASGQLEPCVVKQVLGFALGRPVGADEQGLVDTLLTRWRGEGRSLQALLVEYIGSEAFALRKEGV